MAERHRGTVKWFNALKGSGFIGQQGGEDIFAQFSSVQMDGFPKLEAGQVVELTVEAGTQGEPASNVLPMQLRLTQAPIPTPRSCGAFSSPAALSRAGRRAMMPAIEGRHGHLRHLPFPAGGSRPSA